MSQAATRTDWGWDEFLAWEERQEVRHELIDGRVVAMTGGSSRHDLICTNLAAQLWVALRMGPCRLHGSSLKVRAGDNVRYPDALIDCGPFVPDSQFASEPAAIFEVLSPSTAWIDQGLKLRDYARVPSVRSYVLIAQQEPLVLHYVRGASLRLDIQDAQFIEGLDQMLRLPDFGVELPLSTLYERVTFAPS